MQTDIEKQLVRQLKILNTWITIFGVLLLLALGIIGYFLFQAVTFIRSTNDNIQNFRDDAAGKLDVKSQLCTGNDRFSDMVRASGVCNEP